MNITLMAFLGLAMIVILMALIMAKKLSALMSLAIVPILFGVLVRYDFFDTLTYAMAGIKSVVSTFAMMTFVILCSGIMLLTGPFDPMADKVVKWVKGDPLKVLVGTAILSAFVSLDDDGTTTVMIACTVMIPVFNRLKTKKICLATLIILTNEVMNLIPWGGPTARVITVMHLDANQTLPPLLPGVIISIIYTIGIAYYLGKKKRKRLGVQENVERVVEYYESEDEEGGLKRPRLIWLNLISTIALVIALVLGKADSAILFGFGVAIALAIDYPKNKTQRRVISLSAPEMTSVVITVLGAGVLMGVLDGPVNTKGEYVPGMSYAIAIVLIQMIPSSFGKYLTIIITLISAPGAYLLNNDAFYHGALPPPVATARIYGFSNLQVGLAPLMGQAFHSLSPLALFIYLLMDKTEITLGEYQSYIFRWRIGIFICFMVIGLILGYLLIL